MVHCIGPLVSCYPPISRWLSEHGSVCTQCPSWLALADLQHQWMCLACSHWLCDGCVTVQLRDAISQLAQVPAEGASEHPHLATLYCSHCLCASSCRFPTDVRTWRNDELSKSKNKSARARGTSSFLVMGRFPPPVETADDGDPRRAWSSNWDEYVGSVEASSFDESSWLEPNLRDGRARPAATMEAIVLVVVCVDGSDRTVLVRSGDGHGPSSRTFVWNSV